MTQRFCGIPTIFAGFLALAPFAAGAADLPGEHFDIQPGSLVPPHATPAVDNSSTVVPRPSGALPQVPAGFSVSVFASLERPRFLAVAPNGDVFVSESDFGRITVL